MGRGRIKFHASLWETPEVDLLATACNLPTRLTLQKEQRARGYAVDCPQGFSGVFTFKRSAGAKKEPFQAYEVEEEEEEDWEGDDESLSETPLLQSHKKHFRPSLPAAPSSRRLPASSTRAPSPAPKRTRSPTASQPPPPNRQSAATQNDQPPLSSPKQRSIKKNLWRRGAKHQPSSSGDQPSTPPPVKSPPKDTPSTPSPVFSAATPFVENTETVAPSGSYGAYPPPPSSSYPQAYPPTAADMATQFMPSQGQPPHMLYHQFQPQLQGYVPSAGHAGQNIVYQQPSFAYHQGPGYMPQPPYPTTGVNFAAPPAGQPGPGTPTRSDFSAPSSPNPPVSQEIQRVQGELDAKRAAFLANPADTSALSQLHEAQQQLNELLNRAAFGGEARKDSAGAESGISEQIGEVEAEDPVSPKATQNLIEVNGDVTPKATQKAAVASAGVSPKKGSPLKSDGNVKERAIGGVRHHLCSRCRAIRSDEFHEKYPFGTNGRQTLNYCEECLFLVRHSGNLEKHCCFSCGKGRSNNYQATHKKCPIGTYANYCRKCAFDKSMTYELPNASTVTVNSSARRPLTSRKSVADTQESSESDMSDESDNDPAPVTPRPKTVDKKRQSKPSPRKEASSDKRVRRSEKSALQLDGVTTPTESARSSSRKDRAERRQSDEPVAQDNGTQSSTTPTKRRKSKTKPKYQSPRVDNGSSVAPRTATAPVDDSAVASTSSSEPKDPTIPEKTSSTSSSSNSKGASETKGSQASLLKSCLRRSSDETDSSSKASSKGRQSPDSQTSNKSVRFDEWARTRTVRSRSSKPPEPFTHHRPDTPYNTHHPLPSDGLPSRPVSAMGHHPASSRGFSGPHDDPLFTSNRGAFGMQHEDDTGRRRSRDAWNSPLPNQHTTQENPTQRPSPIREEFIGTVADDVEPIQNRFKNARSLFAGWGTDTGGFAEQAAARHEDPASPGHEWAAGSHNRAGGRFAWDSSTEQWIEVFDADVASTDGADGSFTSAHNPRAEWDGHPRRHSTGMGMEMGSDDTTPRAKAQAKSRSACDGAASPRRAYTAPEGSTTYSEICGGHMLDVSVRELSPSENGGKETRVS